MSELRKDPISERWVIIAEERGERPTDFLPIRGEDDIIPCPFCPNNEHLTPIEILAYRPSESAPNSSDWWLRVIPDRTPALVIEGELTLTIDGVFEKLYGIGANELIIEHREHNKSFLDMSLKDVNEILWAYKDRITDLKQDKRFKYVLISRNRGRFAGSFFRHPHSHLIATPVIPYRVQDELNGSLNYYNEHTRCIYCDILASEENNKNNSRIIIDNELMIAFMPFAPRFPYETWIMPKYHNAHYEHITKEEIKALAEILSSVMKKLYIKLDTPPYNYFLHTAPLNIREKKAKAYSESYHWHIEILPRLTGTAGFEWATGFYINPLSPEHAARLLREVKS